MALTDTAVRAAKPKERDYKLSDGGGLYLLVTAAGGKLWRLNTVQTESSGSSHWASIPK